MDDTITGFVHLDKIADEIGDDAGTCDADYAFQRSAAQMVYDLRNALEQAEARAEELEEYIAKLVCELTDGKLSKPYDISVITDEVESIYRAYAEDEIAKATAKTEAENARLRAEKRLLAELHAGEEGDEYFLSAPHLDEPAERHMVDSFEESVLSHLEWSEKEAARRAVAAGEVKG